MHPLNHGSMCPTSGVAIARYTRGSMDDGPGVSINRTGGWSSPTCCVMTFCPSLFLRLILAFESRTARECALGDFSCRRANLNFRAIPTLTQPTNWPGLRAGGLLSERAEDHERTRHPTNKASYFRPRLCATIRP